MEIEDDENKKKAIIEAIEKTIEYIKEPEKESAQKEDSNKERRLRA